MSRSVSENMGIPEERVREKLILEFVSSDCGQFEETSLHRIQISLRAPDSGMQWYQAVGDSEGSKIYEDVPRAYRANAFPTIRRDASLPDEKELQILMKLYDTAVSGWQMLTDVRFKLLGLLPALSIIAWSQILRQDMPWVAGIAIGLAGFAISVGVWVYNERNDKLYDEFISRARRIELEMGIDTGVFRGRPSPTRRFIDHGTATWIIYSTVLTGWVLVVLWFVVQASL